MAGHRMGENYAKESQEFLAKLFRFHEQLGTPIKRIPMLGGKELDLHGLYRKVINAGGSERVTNCRMWGEIARSFGLPRTVTSASYAIRQHYIKFLLKWEEAENHLLFGAGTPPSLTPSHLTLTPTTPQPPTIRPSLYIPPVSSQEAPSPLRPDRLLRSLQSGLPNEVDFALNVVTILSAQAPPTSRSLALAKVSQLLDLLLAHVAVFPEDDPGLEAMYHDSWHEDSEQDYMAFWEENVPEWVYAATISDTFTKAPYCRSLFNGSSVLTEESSESYRVSQVANILRNLSAEECNVEPLTGHSAVMRFLLLSVNCHLPAVRSAALDTLANLAPQVILSSSPHSVSSLMLSSLYKCILSQDKFSISRGLEVLGELAWCLDNEAALSLTPGEVYQRMFQVLLLPDCQLRLSSLESLYKLSFYGAEISADIAAVSNGIGILIGILTCRVESKALENVKLVVACGDDIVSLPNDAHQLPAPTVPVSGPTLATLLHSLRTAAKPTPVLPGQSAPKALFYLPQGLAARVGVSSSARPGGGVTITPLPLPLSVGKSPLSGSSPSGSPIVLTSSSVMPRVSPSVIAAGVGRLGSAPGHAPLVTKTMVLPRPGQPTVDFAKQWLAACYEAGAGGYVPQVEMYTRYMLHCAEVGQSFVASSDEFANIARMVFPACLPACINLGKHTIFMLAGIKKRDVPGNPVLGDPTTLVAKQQQLLARQQQQVARKQLQTAPLPPSTAQGQTGVSPLQQKLLQARQSPFTAGKQHIVQQLLKTLSPPTTAALNPSQPPAPPTSRPHPLVVPKQPLVLPRGAAAALLHSVSGASPRGVGVPASLGPSPLARGTALVEAASAALSSSVAALASERARTNGGFPAPSTAAVVKTMGSPTSAASTSAAAWSPSLAAGTGASRLGGSYATHSPLAVVRRASVDLSTPRPLSPSSLHSRSRTPTPLPPAAESAPRPLSPASLYSRSRTPTPLPPAVEAAPIEGASREFGHSPSPCPIMPVAISSSLGVGSGRERGQSASLGYSPSSSLASGPSLPDTSSPLGVSMTLHSTSSSSVLVPPSNGSLPRTAENGGSNVTVGDFQRLDLLRDGRGGSEERTSMSLVRNTLAAPLMIENARMKFAVPAKAEIPKHENGRLVPFQASTLPRGPSLNKGVETFVFGGTRRERGAGDAVSPTTDFTSAAVIAGDGESGMPETKRLRLDEGSTVTTSALLPLSMGSEQCGGPGLTMVPRSASSNVSDCSRTATSRPASCPLSQTAFHVSEAPSAGRSSQSLGGPLFRSSSAPPAEGGLGNTGKIGDSAGSKVAVPGGTSLDANSKLHRLKSIVPAVFQARGQQLVSSKQPRPPTATSTIGTSTSMTTSQRLLATMASLAKSQAPASGSVSGGSGQHPHVGIQTLSRSSVEPEPGSDQLQMPEPGLDRLQTLAAIAGFLSQTSADQDNCLSGAEEATPVEVKTNSTTSIPGGSVKDPGGSVKDPRGSVKDSGDSVKVGGMVSALESGAKESAADSFGLSGATEVLNGLMSASRTGPGVQLCCQWDDCTDVHHSWLGLLRHAMFAHAYLLPSFPVACQWRGCGNKARRMKPSLLRHLQTHHCSPEAPPSPPSVATILAKFKHLPPEQVETESLLTKAIRLTAALVLRNIAKTVPSSRKRLLRYEALLSEVALSSSEASTAIAQCLSFLHKPPLSPQASNSPSS